MAHFTHVDADPYQRRRASYFGHVTRDVLAYQKAFHCTFLPHSMLLRAIIRLATI